MQDQIKALAEKFGLQTGQVEAAAGAVFQFIQSKVSPELWTQLSGALPQAQAMIGKAAALPAAAQASAGGLLGQATGLLDKMGGGAQDGVSALAAKLQAAGVRAEAVPQFAAALLAQVKEQAGPEQFKALLGAVPGLEQLGGKAGELLGKLGDTIQKQG